KAEFEFSALLSDRLAHHLSELLHVLCGDASLDRLRRDDLFRIKSKHAKDFGRPIDEVAAAHVPGPTAGMAQALSFSQIGFAATQLLLRIFGDGDIGDRSDKLEAAGRIYRGARERVNMLYRAVRQQQPVWMLEILLVSRRPIGGFPHRVAIFGMGALNDELQGRPRHRVAT